jgi:REP element-mobilizing transposase RayT
MVVYAYCFMPSHVHFVFRSAGEEPMGLLRDFKKYTARMLLRAIRDNPKESRREWMLDLFQKAGRQNNHTTRFQFWQHHNKPIELWSSKVIKQKIDYIHNNPVAFGFATDPVDWKYSSARNFQDDHSVMQIDEIGVLR